MENKALKEKLAQYEKEVQPKQPLESKFTGPTAYPGPNFFERALKLSLLPKGWAGNGEGEPIPSPVIQAALVFLEELKEKESNIFNPALTASDDGSLNLLWYQQNVVVDISPMLLLTVSFTGKEVTTMEYQLRGGDLPKELKDPVKIVGPKISFTVA